MSKVYRIGDIRINVTGVDIPEDEIARYAGEYIKENTGKGTLLAVNIRATNHSYEISGDIRTPSTIKFRKRRKQQ